MKKLTLPRFARVTISFFICGGCAIASAQISPPPSTEESWALYGPDGALTVSVPTSVTMGSNDFKPLDWSILDWDLWKNLMTNLEQSRKNTFADYSTTWVGSHEGISGTSYDGTSRSDIIDPSGYFLYMGVISHDAPSQVATFKYIVEDSLTGAGYDTGPHVEYTTISIGL